MAIKEFIGVKKSIGLGLYSPTLSETSTKIPSSSGKSGGDYNTLILINEGYNFNGTSFINLISNVFIYNNFNINGVSSINNSTLIISYFESINKSFGLGLVSYSLNNFNENTTSSEGVSTLIFNSETFYVWDSLYNINGITSINFDGNILGRLLFRGKQLSK